MTHRTDSAPTVEVILAMLHHARNMFPEACLFGEIRAEDAARALQGCLGIMRPVIEPVYSAQREMSADPNELNAWMADCVEHAKLQGCTRIRVSDCKSDDGEPEVMLIEGWLPMDVSDEMMGTPRFRFNDVNADVCLGVVSKEEFLRNGQ